jgi:hypothetical protein
MYAIDIETEPYVDAPLKKLEINSVQLNNECVRGLKEINEKMAELKKQKAKLIAFNAPFEQTQLTRNGYDI